MNGSFGFPGKLSVVRAGVLFASYLLGAFALTGCLESTQKFGTPPVAEAAVSLDRSRSSVRTGTPSLPADGTSTATISVILVGSDGSVIPDRNVVLSSSRGGLDTITPTIGTTNSNGIALFHVRSITAGTAVFTATESEAGASPTLTASVVFTALPLSIAASTVNPATSTGVTNGGSVAVTVTVTDSHGNPLSGINVSLSTSRPGSDTITNPLSLASGTNGKVVFAASTNANGTSVYTATASGLTLSDTASIQFGQAALAMSFSKTALSATYPATDSAAVTVTNTDSVITATALSLSGVSAPLSISSNTCGSSLAPGASCTFALVFTSPGAASFSQTLGLTYNNGSVPATISQAITATGTSGVSNVLAVYSSAPNWNDYMIRSGNDETAAPDVACAGTESGILPCFHAGEKRKFVLTGVSSCTSLSMSDALGAFNWSCRVSGGNATFFAMGLKDGKGLADLVTGNVAGTTASWVNNSVTVLNGATVAMTSTASAWWGNSVLPLPDNSGGAASVASLASAGTIYVLAASRLSQGYTIDANKIGVVTLSGVRLGYGGALAKNCTITSANDHWCLVSASSRRHLWIEGQFNGIHTLADQDTDYNIAFVDTNYSRIQNTSLASAHYFGLLLWNNSKFNLISRLRIENGESGLLTDAGAPGEDGARGNVFSGMTVTNTTTTAIQNFGLNNTFSRIVTANSSVRAIQDGNGISTWSHLTTANSPVSILAGTLSTYVQTVSVNTTTGIESALDGVFYNTASTNASSSAITLAGGTTTFRGSLLVGGTPAPVCSVSGGGGSGLVNGTCANSGSSSATLTTGVTLATSFVGKVTANDSANSTDTNGTVTFDSETNDLFNFENLFRGWGLDGSAFPNTNNVGACTSGTCRIWDWRLRSTDTALKGRNGVFTAGQSCPASASGSLVITDQQSFPSTFLVNALEIVGDGVGNDNGLCESGESCIYSPNLGAYQGEGNPLTAGSCTFQNSTVTSVTMYGYPTNGI